MRAIYEWILVKCLFIYWRLILRTFRHAKIRSKLSPKLLFGPTPIINNKFWASALKHAGYEAHSISLCYVANGRKDDYDFYIDDFIAKYSTIIQWLFIGNLKYFLALDYVVKHYDIVHFSFRFSLLSETGFCNKEPLIYRYFGVKTVILPFGSDYWQYSRVIDTSYKLGLMAHYPNFGKEENQILKKVEFWNYWADAVLLGMSIDGSSRSDVNCVSMLCFDLQKWQSDRKYSTFNGKNGKVVVAHSPNHRYIKGTEFLVDACKRLNSEGYNIELRILEKIPNETVLDILKNEADILVEKLTYSVYGLSAIEGMALGLPVISNLENENVTTAFRRYSYLNECPLVSATPESIYQELLKLIVNPDLREELGKSGRKYVEKFHSYDFFNFLMSRVYDKIWFEKDVDFMAMFHPFIKDSYQNKSIVQK